MKFAFFLGCQIPARVIQYETSARAILNRLNVELVDIKDFNCCGYPLRNYEFKAFILSSARNLALAEKRDLNILTLCKCCYGSLKKAAYILKEKPSLREEINKILKKEALNYEGRVEIKHLLKVLQHDIGIEKIKERMIKSYHGLRIATHYGCHVLRPSQVVEFDDPIKPSLFDQLVEITGAESIDWQTKLDCCGAPIFGINDELSMDLTIRKLKNAKESGADYVCVACPYCQMQFDQVQKMIISNRNVNHPIPSILYTQLLGLTLGIDSKALGLELNLIPLESIKIKLYDIGKEVKEVNGNN